MIVFDVLAAVVLAAGYVAQMARWLRVLQREHYDPSSLVRFLGRWTSPPVASARGLVGRRTSARQRRPITASHVLIVIVLIGLLLRSNWLSVLGAAAYGVFCPWGLGVRGTTGRLEWTRRLRAVAMVALALSLLVALAGAFSREHFLGAIIVVIAVPPLLDLSTRILRPSEERKARRFVDQAVRRLGDVHPKVVAITGSYGKTSTKNHLAQLLSGLRSTVASPRSFNNRAGLSRAINENLVAGAEVFIAEMGTYGPGEIRDLCSWCPPDVAVVTAIGPVHLERMGSLDVIEAAKHEITERAPVVVLNVDDERLARWVDGLREQGKRVVTAGSAEPADVRVRLEEGRWRVDLDGSSAATIDPVLGVQPTNLACALGASRALGLEDSSLLAGLSRVEPVPSRLNVATAPSGVIVIDDTFNANPASAQAALDALAALPLRGRRVLVTPGMVEMGSEQYAANLLLARRADAAGIELVVVKRTNAVALEAGSSSPVRRFDDRAKAVAWVRKTLGPGDGVLYLNDLPDHYP